MKLLIIGTDTKLFDERSAVRDRAFSYSVGFEVYSVIVISSRRESRNQLNIGPRHNVNLISVYSRIKIIAFIKGLWCAIKYAKEYDVISSQDAGAMGLITLIAARLYKKKLHVQIHTIPTLNMLTKFVIRRADRIRAVSLHIKNMILKYTKANIDVLPIFVDIEKYKSAGPDLIVRNMIPDTKFLILAMSRLEQEKNVDSIIRVFKKIEEKHEGVSLVIVGEGTQKENLEELAKRMDCKRVRFLPWTTMPEAYYKASDVFITLSSFEGYGMTIVESLASGCPVIATNVGIAGEFIKTGYNSWIVDWPVEVSAFNTLDKALTNEEEYLTIRRRVAAMDFNEFPSSEEYVKTVINTFIFI